MPNKKITGEHGLDATQHVPGEIVSHISEGKDREGRLARVDRKRTAFGITPLPKRGGVVTNELIDRLRDEEGI